jgi:hypothetical protein
MGRLATSHKTSIALLLAAGLAVAHAQGGIAAVPNKNAGATREPASGVVPSVAGPSTISVAPKKTHKASAKAKAASAPASR